MGKAPNGLGKFSGKVGGVVFAISNGEQIVRAYQPVVTNPKSALQMQQRSKGNLTGRISSFVGKSMIMGLGDNARRRRSEFLRILLKAANVTTSGNNYTAKIADEDILFSKGSEVISVISPEVTAAANTLAVTLTGAYTSMIPAADYAAKTTRLVAMIYDITTQDLVEVVTKIADKPVQAQTAVTTMKIGHMGGYIAVVYAIPMSTSDGSAMSVTTDNATLNDDEIAALLSVNKSAVTFNYGYSIVLGQGTYTPSAKENDAPTRKSKK